MRFTRRLIVASGSAMVIAMAFAAPAFAYTGWH